jgi:prepilin-type N-terminal cleavage/methylation domain-containing protein
MKVIAQTSPASARRDFRRSIRAFTLLEVMVATMVMALVISTSLIVLERGYYVLDSARKLSYASQVLQSELEKMRLTQWGDGSATLPTAGTGTTGITSYPTTPTALTIDASFYNAGDAGSHMTLTRTATDVHAGMIQVTFKASWTTLDGRPLNRSYTTYYGQKGLYDFISE